MHVSHTFVIRQLEAKSQLHLFYNLYIVVNAFQYTFRQSSLSQLSVVGSEHVMTAFDATQAIKISKSQFDRSAVTPASSVQRLDSP